MRLDSQPFHCGGALSCDSDCLRPVAATRTGRWMPTLCIHRAVEGQARRIFSLSNLRNQSLQLCHMVTESYQAQTNLFLP